MDALALTLGMSWTLAGLVIMGLAVPLVRGRVGRNGLYGAYFREAFETHAAWYAINRLGGRRSIASAVPMVGVGIACFFFGVRGACGVDARSRVCAADFCACAAFQTWRFARRYGAGPSGDGGAEENVR